MPTVSERRDYPKLCSDLRRLWWATGVAFAVCFAGSFAYGYVAARFDLAFDRNLSLALSALAMIIPLFGIYQILTWRVFAPVDGPTLADWVRRTAPRTRKARLINLVSGNGPKTWSVSAALFAMAIVLLVIVDPDLRGSPYVLGASLVAVALSWLMVAFAYAVSYLRLHAGDPRAFDFPGRSADDPPVWRDYVYLAFQVSATFSSSDVTVGTTAARGTVTAQTIVAFVFNTVIVALVVSGIVLIPS